MLAALRSVEYGQDGEMRQEDGKVITYVDADLLWLWELARPLHSGSDGLANDEATWGDWDLHDSRAGRGGKVGSCGMRADDGGGGEKERRYM